MLKDSLIFIFSQLENIPIIALSQVYHCAELKADCHYTVLYKVSSNGVFLALASRGAKTAIGTLMSVIVLVILLSVTARNL